MKIKTAGMLLLIAGISLISAMPVTNVATITAEKDNLCFYPKSWDFGYLRPGETASTQFDIWACCGCAGSITYSLYKNCSWVDVYPTNGTSSGETDTITVTIDTAGLPEGNHSCSIFIYSNNGNGFFNIKVGVFDDHTPPTVKIVKPEKGWIYLNGEKLFRVGFATIVIGDISVEVEAKDDKTCIDKVEIYLNNKLMRTDHLKPYVWNWDDSGFGIYSIRAVAYDGFLQQMSSSLKVLKLM